MKFTIKAVFERIGRTVVFIVTHPLESLKKAGSFLARLTSNKTVLNIAMILCATVFLFSLYNIGIWVYENKRSGDIKNDLIDKGNKNEDASLVAEPANPDEEVDINKIKFLTTNLDELRKINSDTVAWLKVMGTYVDYPVVQTSDNDYYLTHDFYKQETKAGWVFGDFRCDFQNLGKNTIIYGHERMDYSMFGSLTYCKKDWWYKKKSNHFVFLNTDTQKTVWQIFSIYVTSVDFNYIKTGFAGSEDYSDFIKSLNDRNEIPTLKADATGDDQIITLSTCYNVSKRLVVHAKLVKSEYLKPQQNNSSSSYSYPSDYSSFVLPSYPVPSGSSGSSSKSSSSGGSSSSSSSSGSSSNTHSDPSSSSSDTSTSSVPDSSNTTTTSESSTSEESSSSSDTTSEPSSELPSDA